MTTTRRTMTAAIPSSPQRQGLARKLSLEGLLKRKGSNSKLQSSSHHQSGLGGPTSILINGNEPSMAENTMELEEMRAESNVQAEEKYQEIFEHSHIQERQDEFAKFSKSEITKGKILGRGGFGVVREVRAFDVGADAPKLAKSRSFRLLREDVEDDEVSIGEQENRRFISEHCIRNKGDARYAIKKLSRSVLNDQHKYVQGVLDMAVETRILSNLEHPNIVKLRAVSTSTPFSEDYFIVLDRLYDTLEKRLTIWERKMRRSIGFSGKLTDRKGTKKAKLYEARIVAAFDLSAAIEYLHSRRIIHRDLKPENIGFDIRDDIKIFDFGLSKELPQSGADENGAYQMTGMTGSPRYMAPEVANDRPYNTSCDTYSFAIVFWEMLALKQPYFEHTLRMMHTKVWSTPHRRPDVDAQWPVPIKLLLKRAWSPDIKERNTMQQISAILKKEAIAARNGDESGLEHQKRRSTFVFRGKPTRL